MSEFRARIRRVRMKGGGADVHVIADRKMVSADGQDWRATVVRNARAVADFGTEDSPLIGYVLIGFYGDGSSSTGFRYDMKRCPVPISLLPSWIAELVRREMVTRREIDDALDERLGW